MLTELRVRNLALIASAELELGAGLTVLSGETGAGKTALLSSLKLLIGERADTAMIGSAGNEARVEAVFMSPDRPEPSDNPELSDNPDSSDYSESPCHPDQPCHPERSEGSFPSSLESEQELLVVRRITKEGRSRCYLDDTLVTVGSLHEALGTTVDLYGQHEHQSLLKPAEQLKLLDEYAGAPVNRALKAYQAQLQAFKDADATLQELQALSNSSSAEREQAAFALREIQKIKPEPGEYEALEAQLPRLQNSEQLIQISSAAVEQLRGERGALDALNTAIKALEELCAIDHSVSDSLEQLRSLTVSLEETVADISRYATHVEHDPESLQMTLDRLGELDGLSRRFGPGMEQVFALAAHAEQLIQSTEDSEEHINKAQARLAETKEGLVKTAGELAAIRATSAQEFLAELNSSIAELALTGASLEFSVRDLPFERWTIQGSQGFELLYRPAVQASYQPLAKIASGGELSRVMLAIKGLLQNAEQPMTLVFDEIDAGIGGKTANAVAERLVQLAKQHQVIVITHLAQIAAQADRHFLVSKTSDATGVQTSITLLKDKERKEEIARMLSGSTDAEALSHAQKILEEAKR